MSPALPIRCAKKDWSGCVSEDATAAASAAVGEKQFGDLKPLDTALCELLLGAHDVVVVTTAAVLTVGALSIALCFDPGTGACDLFDSHAQPDYEGKAIGLHFEDRQALIDYLLNTHCVGQTTAPYTLTQLERRPFKDTPTFFPIQEDALALVNTLPWTRFFLQRV